MPFDHVYLCADIRVPSNRGLKQQACIIDELHDATAASPIAGMPGETTVNTGMVSACGAEPRLRLSMILDLPLTLSQPLTPEFNPNTKSAMEFRSSYPDPEP